MTVMSIDKMTNTLSSAQGPPFMPNKMIAREARHGFLGSTAVDLNEQNCSVLDSLPPSSRRQEDQRLHLSLRVSALQPFKHQLAFDSDRMDLAPLKQKTAT